MNAHLQAGIPRSVWLVRHGQADWNLLRRYMSDSDRPLTPYGQRQAEALARFFAVKKIDTILHTGLSRTYATAQAIRGSRNIPLVENTAWREAKHGAWEGLTYREVMQRMPDDARQRFANPVQNAPREGESLAAMAARVQQAWRNLGQHHAGQRLLIVTHAGPIQALLCFLMGTPLAEHWRWRIDAGSATGIDLYPSANILRAVNYLPPQLAQ